jgi:hypothetical protein
MRETGHGNHARLRQHPRHHCGVGCVCCRARVPVEVATARAEMPGFFMYRFRSIPGFAARRFPPSNSPAVREAKLAKCAVGRRSRCRGRDGCYQPPPAQILARTGEGRTRAMARGVRFGRKPKLTAFQVAEAIRRREAGEATTAIGRSYGVSHSTISRLRFPPHSHGRGGMIPES